MASFETALRFVDDVKAATTANNLVVAMASLQCSQRVFDFHFSSCLGAVRARCRLLMFSDSAPGTGMGRMLSGKRPKFQREQRQIPRKVPDCRFIPLFRRGYMLVSARVVNRCGERFCHASQQSGRAYLFKVLNASLELCLVFLSKALIGLRSDRWQAVAMAAAATVTQLQPP
ncbi:MAG: hypothetical protein ACI89J_003924 [Hyphomicrobiaceae bacterium]